MCHFLLECKFVFDDFSVSLFAEGKTMPIANVNFGKKGNPQIKIYLRSTALILTFFHLYNLAELLDKVFTDFEDEAILVMISFATRCAVEVNIDE